MNEFDADYKEVINFMRDNKFIGVYTFDNSVIIWKITDEILIKVIIGGHQGNDCIKYYYINNNGNEKYVTQINCSSRNNFELIVKLTMINDRPNYIVIWKSILGIKNKLITDENLIKEYINNHKYTVYKFGYADEYSNLNEYIPNNKINKFIKQINDNKNLMDFFKNECDIDFSVDYYFLMHDLNTLNYGVNANYKLIPFATDGTGGIYVILNDDKIGYESSEGESGIIANNIKDFFAIAINCRCIHDLNKRNRLENENNFVKYVNDIEKCEDECVKLFISENQIETNVTNIYKLIKEAISVEPGFILKAKLKGYVDSSQLFK